MGRFGAVGQQGEERSGVGVCSALRIGISCIHRHSYLVALQGVEEVVVLCIPVSAPAVAVGEALSLCLAYQVAQIIAYVVAATAAAFRVAAAKVEPHAPPCLCSEVAVEGHTAAVVVTLIAAATDGLGALTESRHEYLCEAFGLSVAAVVAVTETCIDAGAPDGLFVGCVHVGINIAQCGLSAIRQVASHEL